MNINPDFRTIDEVIVPEDAQFGWTDGSPISAEAALLHEQRGREALENDAPVFCKAYAEPEPNPVVKEKWDAFQLSKGRFGGSNDWSLLDEFLMGKPINWLPQIVGSCVISNTFRGWVIRLKKQIAFNGEPYELLGQNEFGQQNLSFYAPWSYGMARRRGNMRSGDGLWCELMQASLVKDGVLPCNTGKLIEIVSRAGFARDRDFPEPQNAALYRAFGNWQHLDDLKPYAAYPLVECPTVKSVDELWKFQHEGKPAFICSMLAIRKVGEHRDGFPIHARNPNDQWAHNMCFHGAFMSSDNLRFFRFSNESWGIQHIYNVRYEEVDDWFKRRNVTVAAIGQINGPQSRPLAIA